MFFPYFEQLSATSSFEKNSKTPFWTPLFHAAQTERSQMSPQQTLPERGALSESALCGLTRYVARHLIFLGTRRESHRVKLELIESPVEPGGKIPLLTFPSFGCFPGS